MQKTNLLGYTLGDLEQLVFQTEMPRYTARQIALWLYGKKVDEISDMSNISLAFREKLSERYEILKSPYIKVQGSSDGTRKYLFPTDKGATIESAYIPDRERATLCVSSQAGCRMGCSFCMTSRQGLTHDLSTADILNQVMSIDETDKLTNLVYMGMGEPMDNFENVVKSLEVITSPWGFGWSPSRITVSTIGMVKQMEQLLERTNVNLAVSLHTPFADQRAEIMPVEKAFPIRSVVEALKRYDFTGQRRVSFEYIIFEGFNDTPDHVRELSKLLNGLKCRINIIRFHRIPDYPLASPPDEKIIRFRDALTKKGIMTTIRASRGEDIDAACGLLSTLGKHKI